jgi:hypothetical protein
MSKQLRDQLEDFIKDALVSKTPQTLEDALQKTLDITTPTTPGDLRSTRQWKQESDDDESDEWL